MEFNQGEHAVEELPCYLVPDPDNGARGYLHGLHQCILLPMFPVSVKSQQPK
jgi:hypothetical protein